MMPGLNDSPRFIGALADLVEQSVEAIKAGNPAEAVGERSYSAGV